MTYALECSQQTWLYGALQVLGSLAEAFFLGPCICHYLVQFALLDVQVGTAFVDHIGTVTHLLCLGLYQSLGLSYALLIQLVVQFCILDLLGQVVILPVVSHAIHLTLIALDIDIVDSDGLVHRTDVMLDVFNLSADLLDASGESFNLVLQVLHLPGELSPEGLHLVYLGECGLQGIEVLELLLHIDFCGILCLFLCHIVLTDNLWDWCLRKP